MKKKKDTEKDALQMGKQSLDMANCYKNKNDPTFQTPDIFIFSQQKVEHVKCDFWFSKHIAECYSFI